MQFQKKDLDLNQLNQGAYIQLRLLNYISPHSAAARHPG
jgi:hypothetical protein